MWTLTSKKTGNVYYLLPEKEKHSVGRSSSDLALTGDTSISRSHACIYISQESVKVVDVGSRYGTFCNENIENKVAIEKNMPIELKNGERIQFGMLDNEWVLSKLHISTLTSTLNGENKAELQKIMKALNASIIENWEKSCTHLTMTEVTVTHKVLLALVENIPIVSLDFWRTYLTNLRAGRPPPVATDYLPKCVESFINHENVSFGLVPGRKTIFAGKTFVFMSNTPLEKYRSIIENAGGKCESLYKGVAKSTLVKKNVIVIRSGAMSQTQSSQTVDSIQDFLKKKDRRLIPDAEIGLAILHCNTTKYCNPDYKMVAEFIAESNQIIPNSNIIAKHTSNLKSELSFETIMEIPDSADLEMTEKFKHPQVDLNDSDIEIINSADKSLEKNSSPGDTFRPDITGQGKRKRNISVDDSDQANKKIDIKNTETTTETNSNPANNASMSSALSRNLEIELTSQLTSVPQNQKPSPSTSTAQVSRKTWNLSKFIDTSQIVRSRVVEPEPETVPGGNQRNPETKKRARIAAICSDDDDDDLFAFDSTAPKKAKRTNEADTNNRSTAVRASQRQARSQNSQNTERRNTEKQTNNTTNQSKTKFQLPVRQPIKISTTGWLWKSMCEMKIKSDNERENVTIKKDPDPPAWINSLKGGFEVRVRPMNLISRSLSRSTINGSSSTSDASTTTTGKNYKAFVKKRNYKPQTSIISTVPVYVGVKSHCDF